MGPIEHARVGAYEDLSYNFFIFFPYSKLFIDLVLKSTHIKKKTQTKKYINQTSKKLHRKKKLIIYKITQ